MDIQRSCDIEDVIRQALGTYLNAYVRPLPKTFNKPCVLITQVGGSERDQIGTYDITLDCRADTDASANETLRNAIALLRKIAKEQTTAIATCDVNSSGSWGSDPVRPDIKLCSARLTVTAHLETITI